MHLYKMLTKLTILGVVLAATTAALAIPNCQRQCSNISIPYPFGTSNGCYINEEFLITCDTTFNPPKPFLATSNNEILNISLEGQLKISFYVGYDCYNSLGESSSKLDSRLSLSKFFVSNTKNKFTAVGCDTYATIGGLQGQQKSYTGCLSMCDNFINVINGSCSGIGCCQTAIPKGLKNKSVSVYSFYNHTYVWNFNPCSFAFIVEDGAFKFSSLDLENLRNIRELPLVLDWAIGDQTCNEAIKDPKSYACKENSNCTNSENGPGYLCSCLHGFQGNPYLTNGCQDINECETIHPCHSTCHNLPGSYHCSCPVGYKGDGQKNGTGCIPVHQSKEIVLGICIGVVGLLFLLAGAWWLHKVIRRRKAIKLKQKFFKRNGGLLLQQQLSSGEVNVEKIKMFNSKELEKATDYFNVDRMLGEGGQGTVYKGMLTNGKIVAVKKSKVANEGRLLQQFINEVVILSQINHRNVVKLLGCCLETEVPLLVYEFIPNGTLCQYLHDQNEEFLLTWDMRLRIAIEVAGALSYLHSATSLPIYHRDIKSTNILLDGKYRAKVADFGTSRSVDIDNTHVTTRVQGTFGYLDPEYFQSNQFTEKSDVYSFGVVLVELLTGQKAISSTRTQEGRSLATYFILSMEENYLFDILDAQVIKEDRKEEIMVVAKLAKRCLNLNGKKRPTMKEVTIELEGIQKSQKAFNDSFNGSFNDSQDYEEVEEPWNIGSPSTGSGLDSGITSSFDTISLLSTI